MSSINNNTNRPHNDATNPPNSNNTNSNRNGRGRGRGRGGTARGAGAPSPPPGGRSGGPSRGRGTRGGRPTNAGRTAGRTSLDVPGRPLRSSSSNNPTRILSKAPLAPTTDTKNNGQKGAAAHTVGESYRIRLTRLLLELRDNDNDDSLEFPATLTNTERKFVHELAAQLGLVSKSTGQGANRHITVTKRNSSQKKNNQDNDIRDIPVLNVGAKGQAALRRHLQQFPPSSVEDLEAHETGRSLVQAMQQDTTSANDNNNSDNIAASLQQILGVSRLDDDKHPVAHEFHTLRRHGGMQQRQRFHQQAQQAKRQHPAYAQMQAQRRRLPAYAHQDEIVQAIADHAVTIVCGETGCGAFSCVVLCCVVLCW